MAYQKSDNDNEEYDNDNNNDANDKEEKNHNHHHHHHQHLLYCIIWKRQMNRLANVQNRQNGMTNK